MNLGNKLPSQIEMCDINYILKATKIELNGIFWTEKSEANMLFINSSPR